MKILNSLYPSDNLNEHERIFFLLLTLQETKKLSVFCSTVHHLGTRVIEYEPVFEYTVIASLLPPDLENIKFSLATLKEPIGGFVAPN